MCDTSDGALQHWELVGLWNLRGLFPCDYDSPTYEWIEKSRMWVDQMNAMTHQEVEIKVR
jgi:hypothetical protein